MDCDDQQPEPPTVSNDPVTIHELVIESVPGGRINPARLAAMRGPDMHNHEIVCIWSAGGPRWQSRRVLNHAPTVAEVVQLLSSVVDW